MTLPGASVIEWTVNCERDSATTKRDPVAIKTPYLPLSPEVENPGHILKPLLFCFLRLAERSRVHDIAIVLVQALRDAIHVPRVKCLKPFVDEFDLWGIRAFRVRHWDGAIEGELRGDPEPS